MLSPVSQKKTTPPKPALSINILNILFLFYFFNLKKTQGFLVEFRWLFVFDLLSLVVACPGEHLHGGERGNDVRAPRLSGRVREVLPPPVGAVLYRSTGGSAHTRCSRCTWVRMRADEQAFFFSFSFVSFRFVSFRDVLVEEDETVQKHSIM